MLKKSLLLGVSFVALAGTAAEAQSRRSREDLLDELTRHIQICAEISDTQGRLSCYDKLQTQVGDVQPSPGQPTPLGPQGGSYGGNYGSNPPPPPGSTFGSNPPPPGPSGSTGGLATSGTPLQPPPLMTPGGGTATLGPQGAATFGGNPPPPSMSSSSDPDAAFNPSANGVFRPGNPGPRPQPRITRTGPRPLPNFGQPMPLVTLTASNLTYGDSRYWQVTISITSNTTSPVDTQVQCDFLNSGRSVGTANFGPFQVASGERVTTDMIGPPTSAYVDSTNCRVLSP